MDAKIFRVNYKSDFILTLTSDAGWMTPFCIKFWTGAPSQAYYAQWDGETYAHCAYDPSEPTKLTVQFDDHHLPIGELKYQVAYHFTVDDFPNDTEDEVLNPGTITTEIDGETYQVMLDLTGETAPEIQFSLPAYANEAQRIANEQQRIAAEEARIQNEETRIAAEQTRQQNEETRIAQEEARVTEFARLKRESEAATGAANDAAALANQKAQLAADKAALAQAAATLAGDKAQLAADKAALADAAATLANDKAALAQQKATYAQTQGDYAKEQGDYAKEQGDYAKAQGDTSQADHERAEADHEQAAQDHTTASNDHTQAASDHTTAASDHTRAESDHTTAASDHTTATNDHAQAVTDHTTAAADHTQADNDHTRAESDHTRAESDHAAVEVYVDSLGAFDISAYHATGGVLAKYADLTAALDSNNGGGVPQSLQKGGMSVKFVQSSDNKYVQYRLMAQTFSTDEADWQGVDAVPTAGSKNLVESNKLGYIIEDLTTTKNSTQTYAATSVITDYLFDWGVEDGSTLYYDFLNASLRGIHIIGKLANGTVEIILENIFNKTGNKTVTKDYIKVGFRIKANENANTVTLYSPTSYSELHKDISDLQNDITELQSDVSSLATSVNTLNEQIINVVKNVTVEQGSTQRTVWTGISANAGQYLIVNGTSGAYGTHLVGKKSDNTEEQIGDNIFYGWNNQRVDITSNYKDIGFWSSRNNSSVSVTITLVSKLNDLEAKVNSLLPLLPTNIDSFNNVSFNRERISLFMEMYKLKVVDKMNRLVVSFNGDSIIGSQLDNITKSDEYYTGDFPPNMSKMIMARQFLDDYQFDDADVVYRNIIHSDWVKSTGAFAISNGKDEPDMTFNEIEVYGTENIGDTAQITVTGYTYFKLIWSEYKAASKFQVLCSVNGGNFNPFTGIPEYIEVASGSRCMQKYAIVKLNPQNTYVFKVIATEHPNDILLWGCEMWNNPRLDVVVEAFSGTTARNIVLQGHLEAYHSDWHTPALVVSDILSINDNAFIVGSDQTIDQWMTSNKTIYNRVLDNGISLLLFTPWQTTGQNNLVKMSSKVAIQNDLPYINIQKKQSYITPSSAIYGPDGLHLSNYGNTYYYDELKRVLNDN